MWSYPHVFQPEIGVLRQGYNMKGKWKQNFFKNDNPLVVELGCGMGEYTVGMAENESNKNYIGIDVKGARMWQGATQSLEKGLSNVAFLRIRIEFIECCFNKNEIDEIWITFPDPQIKKRRAKKRLTHPNFLKKYKNIIRDNGLIHLKTDSQFLHGFTLGVIASQGYEIEETTNDIYSSNLEKECMGITTHYEKIYLEKGIPITYLRFRLK